MSNPESALAIVSEAQRMLASASTFADFRDLRDMAETARAYAKAKRLGVESENIASEYILRAERGMGEALEQLFKEGRLKHGGAPEARASSGSITYGDLGITRTQDGSNYRALAAIPADTFEDKVAGLRAASERFAKVDFYRLTKGGEKVRKAAIIDIRDAMRSDDYTPEFRAFEKALKDFDPQTAPEDELAEAASLVMAWVGGYNTRRARQAA